MNRHITRFSSFAEGKLFSVSLKSCSFVFHLHFVYILEEAIETGNDVEKIAKAYTPVEAASKLFFEKQKARLPINAVMSKLQHLPYVIKKNTTALDFYFA